MDFGGVREVVLEVEDVADVGLAPAVDRLIRVADDEEVAPALGQGRDQHVLDPVGVLVLVDEDVAELLLVALEQPRVLVEQADRQPEEVIEINGVGRPEVARSYSL